MFEDLDRRSAERRAAAVAAKNVPQPQKEEEKTPLAKKAEALPADGGMSKEGRRNKQLRDKEKARAGQAYPQSQGPDASGPLAGRKGVADNTPLDFTAPEGPGWGYAVFGKVISGTEVVDKIEQIKTSEDRSQPPKVVIESVTVIE
jgi:cyclophilin family peptidyl-prolyl cis-trans isomerase